MKPLMEKILRECAYLDLQRMRWELSSGLVEITTKKTKVVFFFIRVTGDTRMRSHN